MSASDLLDRWFESPMVKGFMAVNGIIGTWAGPDAPGTAYVLMHHSVGDIGDGQIASWGYPEGGMGAVSSACEASARSFGAEMRTNAKVGRVLTTGGRVRGVALEGGEELTAPLVVTAIHPKITFLDQLQESELPEEFVHDIRHWKTRSGTVKINLAVSELPEFTADPGFDPQVHGGAIQVLDDDDYLERAFQEARFGKAATLPFSDTAIPTVFDKTLAPEGVHVVSMFTQWVPKEWAEEDGHDAELESYADRLIERMNDVAPNFKGSILHRQIIGPKQMQDEWGLIGGNIFHGELTVDQLFHMRPAPGYADYRAPIAGLYQASSATHAGGGVTGMPGHHCVREILKDKRPASAVGDSPLRDRFGPLRKSVRTTSTLHPLRYPKSGSRDPETLGGVSSMRQWELIGITDQVPTPPPPTRRFVDIDTARGASADVRCSSGPRTRRCGCVR